jgi:pimeloyl-ACP methyl ester carboxylesterase
LGEIRVLHYKLFKCKNKDDTNKQFIVLLHGFGGNHKIWRNQVKVLKEKYNVLAIDLPSHYNGNIKLSEMKANLNNVTLEIIKILDSLNIKHTNFMGVSLGTIFIKYIEMYYPEYISKAVLVGAIGKVNKLISCAIRLTARIGDKLPFKLIYSIASKIVMPLKQSKGSRKIFCKCAVALNKTEFKEWMALIREYLQFNKEFERKEHTENIYISGCSDICFIKGIKREVAATKAKFIELKNCGHVCNLDQSIAFNNIINSLFITAVAV